MATTTVRRVKTHNDLSPAVREQMIDLLNQQLADASDLYSQTKQAHWNVKGPQFIALHELFDKLAEGVEGYVDSIAERAVSLGGTAMGTNRMSAAASRLPEYPADLLDGMAHVKALVDRYTKVAASTRAAIATAAKVDDQDTSDLFIEMSREVDKWLWFLEAHLQL